MPASPPPSFFGSKMQRTPQAGSVWAYPRVQARIHVPCEAACRAEAAAAATSAASAASSGMVHRDHVAIMQSIAPTKYTQTHLYG